MTVLKQYRAPIVDGNERGQLLDWLKFHAVDPSRVMEVRLLDVGTCWVREVVLDEQGRTFADANGHPTTRVHEFAISRPFPGMPVQDLLEAAEPKTAGDAFRIVLASSR